MAAAFCLLTPAGRGAVAVIGVAGAEAADLVRDLFQPVSKVAKHAGAFPVERILFGHWRSARGEELVICRLEDDYVEINCHGGAAAPAAICDDLRAAGCTETTPAAWTRQRSTGNLISAEAWEALAAAETELSAAILLDQWSGALAQEAAAIVGLIANAQTAAAKERIAALRRKAHYGLHLTTPWRIVLAGEPNVGKSSLINQLLGFERAIVHAEPGTTRDVVTSRTAFGGWSVELSDTAGQRMADDVLESTGIERGRTAMSGADLVVRVFDARDLAAEGTSGKKFRLQGDSNQKAVLVANKIDLAADVRLPPDCLRTSAITSEGIAELIAAAVRELIPEKLEPGAAVPFTRRQVALLEETERNLIGDEPAEAINCLGRIALGGLPDLPPGAAIW